MKTRGSTYRLANLDLRELNALFAQISTRLDNLAGIGQAKTMHGSRISSVGQAEQVQDALPLGQARNEFEEIGGCLLSPSNKPETSSNEFLLQSERQIEADLALLHEKPSRPNVFWDDMRVPLFLGKPGGTTPSWEVVTDNIYAWHFEDGEDFNISAQLPHSWREGTIIKPHIHWAATTGVTGNFDIDFEYAWFEYNKAITTGTLSTTITTPGSADLPQITSLGSISGEGKEISAVLLCYFSRVAATTGNYADKIYITDIDFHIQKDSPGSTGEYTK